MAAACRPLKLARASSRGFTLLEILVVVIIIGTLAAAVVLAVDGGSARQLDREAERFRALLGQACEQAELSGRDFGVLMRDDGYAFATQLDGYWKPQADSGELRQRRWISGLRSVLSRDGRPLDLIAEDSREPQPQMICYASGELSPFVLQLSLGDDSVRIEGSGDGSTQLAIAERRR